MKKIDENYEFAVFLFTRNLLCKKKCLQEQMFVIY